MPLIINKLLINIYSKCRWGNFTHCFEHILHSLFLHWQFAASCHRLPLAVMQCSAVVPFCLLSPFPPLLSLSTRLWGCVCYCPHLQSTWLTMTILTKCTERSRLDSKLPQSNQPCLCAVTARALAVSPSCPLFFSFSPSAVPLPRWCGVYPGDLTCVREDWQQEWREGQPRFEVSALPDEN